MTAAQQEPGRRGPPAGTGRTLAVALAVAVFGSLLMASATQLLSPRIAANADAERRERLMTLVRTLPGIEELLAAAGAAEVVAQVVDLNSGSLVAGADPADVDLRSARDDPARSTALSPGADLARIGRRPDRAPVYLLFRGDVLEMAILPVFGQGFASMLWGYLALAGDLNTVAGLTFYEHGETPGLGARIDDPAWKDLWMGKRVRDDAGALRIGVARQAVPSASPDAPFLVDGIVGATWTSSGVDALVRFWMGEDGYGPFLEKLAAENGGAP